jgi:hypothetical protein
MIKGASTGNAEKETEMEKTAGSTVQLFFEFLLNISFKMVLLN